IARPVRQGEVFGLSSYLRLPARYRRVPAPVLGVCALGLGALLWVSARQGFAALDPVSLWLGDLWVAGLVERCSFVEATRLRAAAPLGFVALEKLMRALFGDGHLQLQAAPYLARLLGIAGMAWLALELTNSAALALLAAAGFALQDELAVQALRVKHYTLDAW